MLFIIPLIHIPRLQLLDLLKRVSIHITTPSRLIPPFLLPGTTLAKHGQAEAAVFAAAELARHDRPEVHSQQIEQEERENKQRKTSLHRKVAVISVHSMHSEQLDAFAVKLKPSNHFADLGHTRCREQ